MGPARVRIGCLPRGMTHPPPAYMPPIISPSGAHFRVVEAYKRDKAVRPRFREHAAVPYGMGKNIGFKGPDRVSISTLAGRAVVPYVLGKYQAERFGWSKGQCDLVLRRDGKWFLLVTVDVPDGTKPPTTDFIGIDLGVVNIMTDSGGEHHSGSDIEATRSRYAERRYRHCERANRRGQSEFECRACGHRSHADLVAALNMLTSRPPTRKGVRDRCVAAPGR